jgi:hypothetical protein
MIIKAFHSRTLRRTLTGIFIFLLAFRITYSQLFPSFSLSGGPIVGWHLNKVDVLNTELRNAGFPEVSKSGFLTMGGGGFIDLPLKKGFLRIGGLGLGFSTNVNKVVNDSLTKAVNYAFGMGGLSLEYVKPIKDFDIIFGALFSTGTLKLDLYQYGRDNGNYSSIFGEFSSNSSSQNITRNFKVRFYSVQPQLSFGLLVKKFLYFKLTGGYLFTFNNTWKVDNDTDVPNFPSGVKANGFIISLGINAGLFFRD